MDTEQDSTFAEQSLACQVLYRNLDRVGKG